MSKMKAVLSDSIVPESKLSRFLTECKKYKGLLLIISPVIIYFIIFSYIPMYGAIIAFKEYRFLDGILGSRWADNYGMKYFIRFLTSFQFRRVFMNTVIISALRLLFSFPAPIILALLLNEVSNIKFKKIVQSITYLPHFMSWVVLSALILEVLNPVNGAVNIVISSLGFEKIPFVMSTNWFRPILVITGMWKEVGWGSIVYIAAITVIDTSMYEAANIDGASRFQKVKYITLPSIFPIIVILFILRVGNFLEGGFDQILNLYNTSVYRVADIIDTYVYRVGLVDQNYSFSAAIGLFKNIIGALLLILTNKASRKFTDSGIW